MATISGYLKFDSNRTAVFSPTMPGIANVPVVLQNTATHAMLAVYTDINGMYTFTDVPNGTYRIVEAYGTPAVPSPGNFTQATTSSTIRSAFPPINYAPTPPAGATNLDGVTPETLLVTVNGSNLTNENILNGPVKYTPIHTILDKGVTILPQNLITLADNGTFGSFPQGTPANTGANPNPYPNIGSQFTYVQPNPIGVTPAGGQYTIQNISNDATASIQNTWWRIADHTTGNETGRMLFVNGDSPGKVVFADQVNVKPNTYYLLSSWILNLSKSADLVDPQLGVQVVGSNGQILYNATLGTLIPRNPEEPEWKQIGTMINSRSNRTITVRFTSMGPETIGNDYAIDDIMLNEVQIAAYAPQKSVNTAVTYVGEKVTYTVTLANTGMNPLTNISLRDLLPDGFTFVPESVTVNGSNQPDANPKNGFSVPDLPGPSTLTVTFQATADFIPKVNPTLNTASTTYSYTPVVGGIPDVFTKNSTPVDVTILAPQADLAVSKIRAPGQVLSGSVLTYTLNVTNKGPHAAHQVTLTDPTPAGLLSPEYSVDGGRTWLPFDGTYALNTMPPGTSSTILVRGTVSATAPELITNTATVSSPTADPNLSDNSDTVLTPVSFLADLSMTKTASAPTIQAGNVLTYTLTAQNNGPNAAQNVTITDSIPSSLLSPEYSIDGGTTWRPWRGAYTVSTLAANDSVSLLLRGTLSNAATGTLTNLATVSSPTPDPNPGNNSQTVLTPITTRADLSITKTADQTAVQAGNVLTYTLTAQNSGPNDAKDVQVTDTVSPLLTDPQYSIDGGITWRSWRGAYTFPNLSAGERERILIRGTVSTSATGVLTNLATISSATPDPNPGNNSDTMLTPITTAANLVMTKTADQTSVPAGNVLTYTLTAQNNGPNTAQNVRITDSIPGNLLAPEYSADGGATWQTWSGSYTLDRLPADSSVSILIRGTVNSAATGSLTNAATVSSATPDPNPRDNSDTVITQVANTADISITKTADQNPVQAGNTLTYTLSASNHGPNAAHNVTITDNTPASLLTPEYSTDGGRTWQTWSGSYTLNSLPPTSTNTILIRGTVDPLATGILSNTAAIKSTTPDPNPDNNTDTQLTPINSSADISITKTADQNPVQQGSQLTYTLTAFNHGPNDAQNVVIADETSSDLLAPEYSIDGGVTWLPWNGSINLNILSANTGESILIRGIVNPTATGTLLNTASVQSTTPDPTPENNTTTVRTSINTSADLSITKTTDQSPIAAGNVLTYTLTAVNNGPNDAQNVTIRDQVPDSLLFPQYSTDGGDTWQPWDGTYTRGTMEAGRSTSLLIRGTVSNAAVGALVNTASINSSTPDPLPGNNNVTTTTPITTSADLTVSKTSDLDFAAPGERVTYTITAFNNGPNDAQDVTVFDNVPQDLQDVSYSADGGTTWHPWRGAYTFTTLAPDTSGTILIRGTVSSSPAAVIINTATASSATPDPDPTDNSAIALTYTTNSADLSITKTGDQNPVLEGDILTYTLTAVNEGPNTAQGVTISDNTPGNLLTPEYSADGGTTWLPWTGSYTIDSLASDEAVRLFIRGTVSPTAIGVLTNAAAISSLTPDPNPNNNSDTVITPITARADLSIIKTAEQNLVQTGNLLTYTLTATNSGPNIARDIIITDQPAGLLSPQYSTDGGITWLPWNGSYEQDTLGANQSITLLIRGTADSNTQLITNSAAISSSTPDLNTGNNSDTVLTPITALADLSITKTGNRNPIRRGELLTYTITAVNNGPNRAQDVQITDVIPTSLTNPQYSVDGDVTWLPWEGAYTVSDLALDSSIILQIRGRVDDTASGILTNTATVSSPTLDPNPENNSSTEITTIAIPIEIPIIPIPDPEPDPRPDPDPDPRPDPTPKPPRHSCRLVLKKAVRPCIASPGDPILYTITITNVGEQNVENVVVEDHLPEEIQTAVYSIDGGETWHAWYDYLELGDSPADSQLTLLIKGTIVPWAYEDITNIAQVHTSSTDCLCENSGSRTTIYICK